MVMILEFTGEPAEFQTKVRELERRIIDLHAKPKKGSNGKYVVSSRLSVRIEMESTQRLSQLLVQAHARSLGFQTPKRESTTDTYKRAS